MSKTPEPELCPECGAVATEQLHFAVHLIAGGDFLDAEGREHRHDPNGSGVGFKCANGHTWVLPCRCWCGWTDAKGVQETSGFSVQLFTDDGEITSSAPPSYATTMRIAFEYFEGGIKYVQEAEPGTAGATVKEVRLSWRPGPHKP